MNGTLSFHECRLSSVDTQRWWGHSNTPCFNQICLKFLHRYARMLTHLFAPACARATWWSFHYLFLPSATKLRRLCFYRRVSVHRGVYPSMHCRRYPSIPLSRPTPKGEIEGDQVPGPRPRGKWRGIRSRPTPKGEMEGGSDPGPHPRGKWRRIRSRPTPKGEIEGDQIQAPFPSLHGGMHTSLEQTPPGSRHPGSRHPWEQTPPRSRHLPGADPPGSRHPREQTPPKRRPLLRTVRILLECILVLESNWLSNK